MKHVLIWMPAFVAMVFLAVTGVMMVRLVTDVRDITLVNLQNTCFNSEHLRSGEDVERTCWSEYRGFGGR